MQWLRRILAEIFGLFVDDASYAIAILLWLGLFWLLVSHTCLSHGMAGLILFLGLAGILVAGAARRARTGAP